MTAEVPLPQGGPRSPAVDRAVRDALDAIERHRRGEIDGLALVRTIVNDEPLREIVPIRFLLGFIGVESQFGADPDDEHADPAELAELRAEREEQLAEESAGLTRDCTALAEHLEQWQRDHPPRVVGE